MTTAIAVAGFDNRRIDIIRNTVARGANDNELALFLEFCQARALDPFTRQVYWTRQGVITGIDGLRCIAERTGAYRPGDTSYTHDGAKLVAASVTVHRRHGDAWYPLTESAYLEEYRGETPTWKKMPRVMLAKCAEARALRRAFPAVLGGLYVREEMDQAQEAPSREAQARVVDVKVTPVPRDDVRDRAFAFAARYCDALDACADFDSLCKCIDEHAAKVARLQAVDTDIHSAVTTKAAQLSSRLTGGESICTPEEIRVLEAFTQEREERGQ